MDLKVAEPFAGTMEIEEFLTFLKGRPDEERWDLIDGVAVMMAPPTLVHQWIASNLQELLNAALSGRPLRAVQAVGLRIPGLRRFNPEPDVAVLPGPATYSGYADTFLLVAEIVSDSNTREEIGVKVERYKQHPENLYALVIEQRSVSVELHERGGSSWSTRTLTGLDDILALPAFGFRQPLAALYAGTPLSAR